MLLSFRITLAMNSLVNWLALLKFGAAQSVDKKELVKNWFIDMRWAVFSGLAFFCWKKFALDSSMVVVVVGFIFHFSLFLINLSAAVGGWFAQGCVRRGCKTDICLIGLTFWGRAALHCTPPTTVWVFKCEFLWDHGQFFIIVFVTNNSTSIAFDCWPTNAGFFGRCNLNALVFFCCDSYTCPQATES